MAETLTKVRQKTNTEIAEPTRYKVVIYNDNVTPMEFVIAMLMKVFRFNEMDSATVMLKVHEEGSAIAGIYSYEIAEQKCLEATDMARKEGFPLVIKVEAE
jgi:ATP-dependent Clp protease adaptor protein ClpS